MSTSKYQHLERWLSEFYEEVPPAPAGLAKGREQMLAEGAQLRAQTAPRLLSATETVEVQESGRRRKMNLLLAYKVLAVVMAIAVAVGGAGGGVALAADSVPGDLLYPVKLFGEEVSLLLTWDPAAKAELNMAFASERVREMTQLAARGEEVPEDVVARLTRQMEQAMVQIAQARPEEVPALLTRVMERARVHQETLERAQVSTRVQVRLQLRQAAQVMERTLQAAQEGLGEPLRFRQEYQQRYEGPPGPHGEPSATPRRTQEQEGQQQQYQYEGTPGPHGEEEPSPSPAGEEYEYQYRYEGTPGPHGEPSAPPDDFPAPTETPSPDETGSGTKEPERSQEEHQYPFEGTPDPHTEASPSSEGDPEPTGGPEQSGQPESGR